MKLLQCAKMQTGHFFQRGLVLCYVRPMYYESKAKLATKGHLYGEQLVVALVVMLPGYSVWVTVWHHESVH